MSVSADRAATRRGRNDVLAGLRLLILDVDGVLTDGALYYGASGESLKVFHVHDGLGMRAARENGLALAVISARRSEPLQRRLDDLGVTHAYLGVANKLEAFEHLLVQLGLAPEDSAYLGDDLIDVPVMQRVGYPMAVQNAQPRVRDLARFVTERPGGDGAVRQAIDHILAYQVGLEAAYRFVLAP